MSSHRIISHHMMPKGEMLPTSHDPKKFSVLQEMLSSSGQSSKNPANSDFIRFLLHDVFFVILVVMYGVEPTILIFELDSLASSLIEHHVAWHYVLVDQEDGEEIWEVQKNAFSCIFIFSHFHIFVQGGGTLDDSADSFKVSYEKHDGPNRKGNPSNGAFPAVELDLRSSDLEDLKLFCEPKFCRYQSELFYDFGHLKIFVDDQRSYIFFVFSSVEFYIDVVNQEKEFKFPHLEFSFPILSGSEPSPDSIVFEHFDYCNGHFEFVASFNIQIGSDFYKCDVLFGLFLNSSYRHSDGSYALDIIRATNGTTKFLLDDDFIECEAEKKVGFLILNIPTFRAPKTSCPSELASELKGLPKELQSFLREITWKNPASTAVQAEVEAGSI